MIYYAPEQLNRQHKLIAGITYASREKYNSSEYIEGLNFGENTVTPLPVIKHNLEVLNHEINHDGEFALAEQVHGADVAVISDSGYYSGVDGLVTTTKNLVIAIKVADCGAVLLSDPANNIIAAVHAGWRGAAAGILPNALDKIKKAGARPANIICYISPCISLQNFEIGEEVAEKFPSQFIDRSIGHKPHLNLKEFLRTQLVDAGVAPSNIEIDSRCTVDNTSFYSHRRERDKAGRMLAFIKQSPN
ncbi:peptidoglycan editing factor PgeF [Rhodohalobacter sp. 8-1]|uniref:peptidoglycan editing factor PgeF n=1 Tax=Rhodohalobacter sp. 8-1 TaxID=3131972 RepID=UPI0030EF3D54